MPYARARLIGVFALAIALPLAGAGAQSELPAVLRGARTPAPVVPATAIPPTAIPEAAIPEAAMPAATPAPEPGLAVDGAPGSAAPILQERGAWRDLPKPFAAFSATAQSLRDSLVTLARAQIGRRYRFGGTTPEHGFDCSGLVRYVMAALHIDLPRTAKEQARTGARVPRDTTQLRPGDLVTFGSTRRISHIGIYVGDGRFVQASSKAGRVIETRLNRPLVKGVKPWRGVRRLMPAEDSATVSESASPLSGRADAE